jgi:NAD(P)-dependent dehydrogenase (short-subunit alcohol dehydrogenase family)
MHTVATYPSLRDCPVLISGGATGIGAELVVQFAAQGARVGFVDIDEAAAARLTQTLAGSRHVPVFLKTDVTDLEALRSSVAQLERDLGSIRVLLNNAANDARQALAEVTPESWDRGVSVNLRHQFFAVQGVAEGMKQTGGSIINLGSISWMLKMPRLAVYATSKAAVHGLTRSLARELGPWKIRVNTLTPGWTMTQKQLREHVTAESHQQIAQGQCLPDKLEPRHVAQFALFLASDASEMCTGQEFIVDGGWV